MSSRRSKIHALLGLLSLFGCSASVHGVEHADRLQTHVLVGTILVRQATASLYELQHRFRAVALLL